MSALALKLAQFDGHTIRLGVQAKLLANVVPQLLVRGVFKVLERGQRTKKNTFLL